jgi:hypothetical protein
VGVNDWVSGGVIGFWGFGVHIRCCGHGGYWFRFYSESLSKSAKVTKALFAPFVRCLAQARHALAPVLLRGPAAIGHPWPCAANPASMPGCPLRRTCTRPLEGAVRQHQKRGGLPAGLSSSTRVPPVGAAEGCDLLILLWLWLWLLILIHPPLREASFRCSSGDWRAAPFDAVEPIACRS